MGAMKEMRMVIRSRIKMGIGTGRRSGVKNSILADWPCCEHCVLPYQRSLCWMLVILRRGFRGPHMNVSSTARDVQGCLVAYLWPSQARGWLHVCQYHGTDR